MDEVSQWKTQVDSFLAEVARWVHDKIPLEFGLVGFEVDCATVLPEAIRATGIPAERDAGILWNNGLELKFFPSTRP
jgi:hypothetical protein